MKMQSIKTQLSIFLGIFAAYLSFVQNDIRFLIAVLVALLSSVASDSIFNYIKGKRLVLTESSVVTGLIIGYVLSSDTVLWIIALASVFAIASKHIVRFRKSHIFNPAGLGVFLTVLFFGAYTQWKAAYLWYIMIPAGLYFAYRIKKFDLLVGYFIASLFLYIPQSFLHQTSLLNIFGYFNYFFILIMMIEPRTSPDSRFAKIIFGLGAAAFIFAFYEFGVLLEAELFALLILNFLGVLQYKR